MFNLFKKKKIENKYHRYLNLPIDPKVNLFDRTDYDPMFYRHVRVDQQDINAEVVEWFENIGIHFYWFEAFYTPPFGGKIPIHTDTPELCDVVKINWTYGAPKSKLIWWEAKDSKYIDSFQTEFGAQYLTIKEKHAKRIYEAEINKPSLVNIGHFHSTYNPTSQGRWTLSLPLMHRDRSTRLDWTEALSILKNYIDDER